MPASRLETTTLAGATVAATLAGATALYLVRRRWLRQREPTLSERLCGAWRSLHIYSFVAKPGEKGSLATGRAYDYASPWVMGKPGPHPSYVDPAGRGNFGVRNEGFLLLTPDGHFSVMKAAAPRPTGRGLDTSLSDASAADVDALTSTLLAYCGRYTVVEDWTGTVVNLHVECGYSTAVMGGVTNKRPVRWRDGKLFLTVHPDQPVVYHSLNVYANMEFLKVGDWRLRSVWSPSFARAASAELHQRLVGAWEVTAVRYTASGEVGGEETYDFGTHVNGLLVCTPTGEFALQYRSNARPQVPAGPNGSFGGQGPSDPTDWAAPTGGSAEAAQKKLLREFVMLPGGFSFVDGGGGGGDGGDGGGGGGGGASVMEWHVERAWNPAFIGCTLRLAMEEGEAAGGGRGGGGATTLRLVCDSQSYCDDTPFMPVPFDWDRPTSRVVLELRKR